MTRAICTLIGAAIGCSLASPRAAIRNPQSAIRNSRVMLLDGESGGPYHRWQVTTPVLKKMLDETQLFTTEILTLAAAGAAAPPNPSFTGYAAVVLNYDAPDERWTADTKRGFERYVEDGGGLVAVHAADNAFPGWRAYNEMIGVGGWRDRNESAGPRWFVKEGALASDPAPGPAGSHGTRLPFAVTVRDANHPIVKGLPVTWMHQGD